MQTTRASERPQKGMSFLAEEHAQERPIARWELDIDGGLRPEEVFAEVESRSTALRGFRAGGQRRRESRRNLRAGREEGEMKSSSQESIPANWIKSKKYANG
ncbi:hypothetical protein N7508_007625 [Penicillium antarcticum]|uniref:uncharacterized protein n=1 Tax=Penicillium antarcticum TaxID=416450 RepID=UPI00238A519A|nr:uncharacterized protein N7508_007625 [Penicillium antarcticum]KAJ5297376.1 hypothetical protein N7508_007625 [Penicillium antarcticum]